MCCFVAAQRRGGFSLSTKENTSPFPSGQRQRTISSCAMVTLAHVGLVATLALWLVIGPLSGQYNPVTFQGQRSASERQLLTSQLPSTIDLIFSIAFRKGPFLNGPVIAQSLIRTLTGQWRTQYDHPGYGPDRGGQGLCSPNGQSNIGRVSGGWGSSAEGGDGRRPSGSRGGNQPPGGDGASPDVPGRRLQLMCPFYKLDPRTHEGCKLKKFRSTADIRRHVLGARIHPRQQLHCPICKYVVREHNNAQGRDNLNQHLAWGGCMASDIEVPGITEIQVQQIKDPTNRVGSEEDRWFALWDILFPNRKRPFSPYLGVADTQEEFPQGIVSMTPGHGDLAEDESISTSSPLVNHRSPPQILEYASQRPVQPPAMVAHYAPTPVGMYSQNNEQHTFPPSYPPGYGGHSTHVAQGYPGSPHNIYAAQIGQQYAPVPLFHAPLAASQYQWFYNGGYIAETNLAAPTQYLDSNGFSGYEGGSPFDRQTQNDGSRNR